MLLLLCHSVQHLRRLQTILLALNQNKSVKNNSQEKSHAVAGQLHNKDPLRGFRSA